MATSWRRSIVIADPEQKLYKAYRAEKSVWGLLKVGVQFRKLFRSMVIKGFGPKPHTIDSPIARLPVDLLIDEELVIRTAHYATDIGDHLSNAEIHAFLDAQKGAT